MKIKILSIALPVLATACASADLQFVLDKNHPANPHAIAAPLAIPHDWLTGPPPRTAVPAPTVNLANAPLSAAGLQALAQLLEAYMTAGDQLAADKWAPTPATLATLKDSMATLEKTGVAPDAHFWHAQGKGARARQAVQTLAAAKTVAPAREAYLILSQGVEAVLILTGAPPALGKPLLRMHCTMYQEKTGGAVWFQTAAQTRNPFFGEQMLRCASQKNPVPTAKSAPAKPEVKP